MSQAKDLKHLRQDLMTLWIIHTLLEWGCQFEISQCEVEKLRFLEDKIITMNPNLCIPEFTDDTYSNVNIQPNFFLWNEPKNNLDVIVATENDLQ